MRRRDLLAALGGGGVIGVAGIASFMPELIVGSPRGEGDPISINRTIRDDSIEYRPASDTVRWPELMTEDGPHSYKTEPFEDWASRKCAVVGSDAVLPAIQDRFEKELQGIGTGASGEFLGMVISVHAITRRSREGEVVSEPNFAFQTLVNRTPRTVQTTISLENRTHSRSVPVFVDQMEVSPG